MNEFDRKEYIAKVNEVGKARQKKFGKEFNWVDFLMGASVIFDQQDGFDVPPMWIIGPMSGRNPFLDNEEELN